MFRPPGGTTYTRTARWTRDIALLRTPLRREDSINLLWHGKITDEGGSIVAEEVLESVKLASNGSEVAEAKAMGRPVVVRYVFATDGRLTSVTGTDAAAEVFVSLLPPSSQTAVMKNGIRQALEESAFARAEDRFGAVVGRRAKVGETWRDTASAPAGSTPSLEETYRVAGVEACALGTCVRLDREVKVDPQVVAASFQAAVSELVAAKKGDPALQLKEAHYKEGSSTLLDPKTMLTTQTKQANEGAFSFEAAKSVVDVEVKVTREVEFDYTTRGEGQRSSGVR